MPLGLVHMEYDLPSYVFDTSSISVLKSYYPDTFVTFWDLFEDHTDAGKIISTREVLKEIEGMGNLRSAHVQDWVDNYKHIFKIPTSDETHFVYEMFKVTPHFKSLIGNKQTLNGRPVADPFVIASAKIHNAAVVTEEKFKPHAAKIPNVCLKYGIDCISIEEMLRKEKWEF